MMLLDRVRRTIRRHGLAVPSTRVVAAVSGGSDSVALAHLLHALDRAGELQLVAIAHVHHGLRDTADRDETLCRELAHRLARPFESARVDVRAAAVRDRRSLEHAARHARYTCLHAVAGNHRADAIALGHTSDDQAETYLMRLIRGAGPTGLASMHPRAGLMIRPLLDCRRNDLRGWLNSQGIRFEEDETNGDLRIPRNRVRAELLPLLEARFNPNIVDTLAREAELARDEWRWLEAEADALDCGRQAGDGAVSFDLEGLRSAPPAVQRYALWRALGRAARGRRTMGLRHVENLQAWLATGGVGGIDLPGLRVERSGATVVLRSGPAGRTRRMSGQPANLFEYPLSIPGEVHVPEAGCVIAAEVGGTGPSKGKQHHTVVVQFQGRPGPLVVRSRRPGDRFQPIGMDGHKRLQDLFVDRKVPRADRDRIPVVADAAGRIVWVVGHGIDAGFRVTDPAQCVIVLRIKLLGGVV